MTSAQSSFPEYSTEVEKTAVFGLGNAWRTERMRCLKTHTAFWNSSRISWQVGVARVVAVIQDLGWFP